MTAERATGTRVLPGEPYPLGARYDGLGTNFAIFSEVAEKVELCLFDPRGEEARFVLPEVTAFCWHAYLPNIQPGQRYGYRVHGPYDPGAGHRCNPAKLLLDPYARAIEGSVQWHPSVFPYQVGGKEGDLAPNDENNARYVPKSVVTHPYFDWGADRPPATPWQRTVVYEAHVKGLTFLHPEVPPELRGTYAALGTPPIVDHLHRLGVTAVELLPVHQFIHDKRLVEAGLRNYWGYNSIGYLAPHNEYSSAGDLGGQVNEFKQMVKTLHEEGIEVILDVVYNHTAEGNELGPMLSFKGIDNAAYYRLNEKDQRFYVDYTGTGNSLNMRHPHVLQLIMDSLRYWVTEMHVDGFRFDLAATLARELHDVDRLSAFFDIIQQDPVIRTAKLIAEPWDVGEGGYQVGNFPPLWSEWNGKYRDTMRDFWRGEMGQVSDFAYRLTGSADLYESSGRRPYSSINFITAHDGFTLNDLVSYNDKHNELNGEENQDGENHNRSWNSGVEGPTDDEAVLKLRRKQRRNFLATLLLSEGVPMMLGGDEFGRSQGGNNNAYCQDNEISWFDWRLQDHEADLFAFAQRVVELRRRYRVFQRKGWFQGRDIHGSDVGDIGWFTVDGKEMSQHNWDDSGARSIAVFLNGEAVPELEGRGLATHADSFFLLFNAHTQPLRFTLPGEAWGSQWEEVLNTSKAMLVERALSRRPGAVSAGQRVTVQDRSMVVLRRVA